MEFSKQVVTFRNIARNLRVTAPPNSVQGTGLVGDKRDNDDDKKKAPRELQFMIEPIKKADPSQHQYFAIKSVQYGLYAVAKDRVIVLAERPMPMAIERLGPPDRADNRWQIVPFHPGGGITLAWAIGGEREGHPVILQLDNPSDENQIWNIDHIAEQQ